MSRKVQLARIEHHYAPLTKEFAQQMARRWFPTKIIPSEGYLHWDKILEGGWVYDGPGEGNGHVERPGTKNVCVCEGRDRDALMLFFCRSWICREVA